MPKPFLLALILCIVVLAACGGDPTRTAPTTIAPLVVTAKTTEPPTNPTTIPIAQTTQPSNNPTAAPATASDDSAIPSGVTTDGFYYLGNPDAMVTLIDYSDFL